MNKADFYRKRHLELKNQEAKEESIWEIVRDFMGLVVAIAIILAVCILAVPQI